MKTVFLALALSAGQAGAQAVELSNCAFEEGYDRSVGDIIRCGAANVSDTAVADIRYGVRLTEPGRTVPWGEMGFDNRPFPMFAAVKGGIEPGETVSVIFRGPGLPERADPETIVIEMTVIEALDVNGEPI